MEPSHYAMSSVLSIESLYISQKEGTDNGGRPDADAESWSNELEHYSQQSPQLWRCDGVYESGSKFFILPRFAIGRPPLRIDIIIPDQADHPPGLRRLLRSSDALLGSRVNISSLGIVKHVICALEAWSASIPDFEQQYCRLPFGSCIVLNSIVPSAPDTEIVLYPRYEIEQQWNSINELQSIWGLPADTIPPIIEWSELKLHSQPHEALSIVDILETNALKTYAFKALTYDVKNMYHELKVLLSLEEHPNIVPPPAYLVSKRCRFGGKQGICGFLLVFYPLGSLRKVLLQARMGSFELSVNTKLCWARQITSAMIHVHQSAAMHYSDLKCDNVVVHDNGEELTLRLIDFEQRGAWYSASPPEIYYLQYLERLASTRLSEDARTKYSAMMRQHMPEWKPASLIFKYQDIPGGYCAAWQALSPSEQEKAAVFMLGKLLWCIFEENSSSQSNLGHEIFQESDNTIQFPDFRLTPKPLRQLILSCTSGALEHRGRYRPLVMRDGKLYPLEGSEDGVPETQQVHAVARSWWLQELRDAERFLQSRSAQHDEENDSIGPLSVMEEASRRPTLLQVLQALESYDSQCTATHVRDNVV